MKNAWLKLLIRKIKNLFHFFEAFFANIYYRFPSKNLKVIGVTGTDGKTTTVHLIYHILKTAGKKVSMISTVYAKIGNQEFDTGLHTTTPSSFVIQKFLRQAADSCNEYFVLETTSHALDQYRVWGVKYFLGVLTNVTHEHLDYHYTYENYLKTKIKLLKMAKIRIVNEEDSSYQFIKKINLEIIPYNSKLKILDKFKNLSSFNKQNFAAAYTVGRILGISEKQITEAMKSFQFPPGRMEMVFDGKFKVIIDFAHTPNAFKMILPEIKKKYLSKNQGRLIHVFGCAGERDYKKRPLMGEISAQYADIIILTEEDYRTEDVEKIIKQIEAGIKKIKKKATDLKIYQIIDRKKAIEKAIEIAKPNDVIVLTGKAHEKSLCRGKIEYPWDEFLAVKNVLKKFNYVNL